MVLEYLLHILGAARDVDYNFAAKDLRSIIKVSIWLERDLTAGETANMTHWNCLGGRSDWPFKRSFEDEILERKNRSSWNTR